MAAGPSPFGGEGLTLLQIGVQGRPFRDVKRRPVHLVLTVDVSASMRQGGRLDMLPRAVDKLLRQLGPDDRVSLIAFSEQSRVVIEDAGREDADVVRQAVASLEAEKSTNIPAALRRAYTVARQHAEPGKLATLVVLLTDGTAEVERAAADTIEKRLAEARPRDIRLEVVDLGFSSQSAPQLERFAQAGGGKVRRAASADQVCWTLLEAMTGKPQTIAADVRLSVTFNPKNVLEYRLLGHEPSGMTGVLPGQAQTDFHVGQSATALYEVRLAAATGSTGGQDIATVEVQWQPPEGGKQRQIARKVSPQGIRAAVRAGAVVVAGRGAGGPDGRNPAAAPADADAPPALGGRAGVGQTGAYRVVPAALVRRVPLGGRICGQRQTTPRRGAEMSSSVPARRTRRLLRPFRGRQWEFAPLSYGLTPEIAYAELTANLLAGRGKVGYLGVGGRSCPVVPEPIRHSLCNP